MCFKIVKRVGFLFCVFIFPIQVLDDKLVFVKVHAPWEVLCTYAEIMHIKLPLKPNDLKNRSSAFGTLNWFTKVLSVDESIIKPEQEFFTAPFEKNRMNDFYIVDRDAFFNPATRSRIVSLNQIQLLSWGNLEPAVLWFGWFGFIFKNCTKRKEICQQIRVTVVNNDWIGQLHYINRILYFGIFLGLLHPLSGQVSSDKQCQQVWDQQTCKLWDLQGSFPTP